MGQSTQVLNRNATMEKSQQKILDIIGTRSRSWKGLEDIKNTPDDIVSVPVEDHIKLIEQTVLLPAKRRTRFCIVDVYRY